MKKVLIFFVVFAGLVSQSCSKSSEAEPQIAQKIVGSYTLTKLTKGTTAATGTGTATISATDNTTASIRVALKIGNTSQDITLDYKISQNGADYVIKDGNGANTVGSVSGNKLTMTTTVLGLGSSDTYTAEFTK